MENLQVSGRKNSWKNEAIEPIQQTAMTRKDAA
jgi:hypothetical protein